MTMLARTALASLALCLACSSKSVNDGNGGGGTGTGGSAGADAGADGGSTTGGAGGTTTGGTGGALGGTGGGTGGTGAAPSDAGSDAAVPCAAGMCDAGWWVLQMSLLKTQPWATSLRGSASFTATAFTIASGWTSSTGAGGTDMAHPYSMGATRSLVLDQAELAKEKRGQISRNWDFVALTNVTSAVSTTVVRKSSVAPPIASDYAMLGLLGDKSSAMRWAIRGQVTLDAAHKLSAGSYDKANGVDAPTKVTLSGGTLTIASDGAAQITTQETPGSSVTLSGQATPDGALIVLSYNPAGAFHPGIIVLVGRAAPPSGSTPFGSYQLAELAVPGAEPLSVRGSISLLSGGAVASGTTLQDSALGSLPIIGGSFGVDNVGTLKLDLQTPQGTKYWAGQITTTASSAPVLVTSRVGSSAFGAVPSVPALGFWVLE